ncbi:MAG: hypothetical protein Q8M32_15305, partial [Brevundimonas sp.]|nr:hypothetical protein [Brevundimonas sp.]
VMNGHDLEALVIAAHPLLNKYHERTHGRGTLTKTVVRRVVNDHLGFCPMPVATAFRALANSELQ